MAGPHTSRARARSLMITDIKTAALTQLAAEGAARLSLRAVARELGMVSSAIYRYYASRDDLLTALIVDAYADLAAEIRAADRRLRPSAYASRWTAATTALRVWAVREPHRFGLVYGTVVPGYRAPAGTIAPAAEVVTALFAAARDASRGTSDESRPEGLATQLRAVSDGLELGLDAEPMLAAVGAFAELIGLLTLELGGHFVGGFEPADALWDRRVRDQTDRLDLTD